MQELLVHRACDGLTKESEEFCKFQQLSLPSGGRSFYAMSLLFYVSDFFSMAEGVIERKEIQSAENKLYKSTVLIQQMKKVHQLSWG